jgi:hypothetical protein
MSTHQPPRRSDLSRAPHSQDHRLNVRESALLLSAFLALGLSILSVLTI